MRKAILFKNASENYQKAFEKYGIEVLFIEALQFQFINSDILYKKLTKEFKGIILTSPRAIEAVSNCWDNHLQELWKSRKVYTVGEGSCAKIKELLNLSADGSESGSAENLVDIIIKENKAGTDYLFPYGNLKTETIVINLQKCGINVDGITVYETKENVNLPCKLATVRDLSDCSMFFFSPSGAEYVLNHLKSMEVDHTTLQVFAIGNTTCKKLQELEFHVTGVASKPNPQCLIEQLNNWNK